VGALTKDVQRYAKFFSAREVSVSLGGIFYLIANLKIEFGNILRKQ
jgi:hypothetical protein